ncbi:DUF4157 domain-containing protein [Streptomyces sp. NPDC002225]|uniref:eCIS core domain-containing protein n=1 Tax=Streptomyces sp. NPDC002225 TaxID=3154413 RepID=UPI00331DC221
MRAHEPTRTPDTGRARANSTSRAGRPAGPARQTEEPAPLAGDLSPSALRSLQRSMGNAYVTGLIQRERHRHGPDRDDDREGVPEGARRDGSAGGPVAGPAVQRSTTVHEVLRGSGRAMDAPLRQEMETRLGADFSDVRLHTGAVAQRSAAEVGAHAYTSGNHIVLGRGGDSKHTLAHELTHVIQQRHGPVAGTDNGSGLSISDPSDRFERAAEANATRVMAKAPGELADPAPAPHGPAQRPGGAAAVQRVIHQEPSYQAKVGDSTSLTNRGDIDVEEHGGEQFVRVYQTVYAPVTGGGNFKDTQQREDGSINLMHQKESAWLNMGRPWRSMHYMRTYQDQKNRKAPDGNASPAAQDSSMVRSFLVPLYTYQRVTSNAVSEKQIGSVLDPENTSQSTDKAKDTDQYEIRGVWRDEVADTAVPNSLITYVRDDLVGQLSGETAYGEVRPISDMLGKLSMPDLKDFPEYRPADQRDDGLVLPLNKGKMPGAREQDAHIDRLADLVAKAYPKNGETHLKDAKNARKELKKLAGLDAAKDRDIDWDALKERIHRAMNYAGVPAVLAEIYNAAKGASGDEFKTKPFGSNK